MIITSQRSLQEEMWLFDLEVVASSTLAKLMILRVQPTLLKKVKSKQTSDEKLQKVQSNIKGGRAKGF